MKFKLFYFKVTPWSFKVAIPDFSVPVNTTRTDAENVSESCIFLAIHLQFKNNLMATP